jgi:ABC-type sulfate transport system permease component
MTRTTLGILIGLALGLALAFGSFGQMLIVALFVAVGFVVAKVLDGDLDLSPYLSRRRSGR